MTAYDGEHYGVMGYIHYYPPAEALNRLADELEAEATQAQLDAIDTLSAREPGDAINPAHYQGFSHGAQVIDIAEHLDFLTGNIVKYAARLGKKPGNDALQEARKIQWYANRLVEKYEREA